MRGRCVTGLCLTVPHAGCSMGMAAVACIMLSQDGLDAELWGVRCLHFAVLRRAVKDLAGQWSTVPREQKLAARAREWFNGDGGDHAFSFERVCLVLELDRDKALRGVQQLRVEQLAAVWRRVEHRAG